MLTRLQPNKTLFQTFQLLLLVTIILGACHPGPGKTVGTPKTTESPTNQDTPVPQSQDSGLAVIDDGSPIPPVVVEQQPSGGMEFPVDGQIRIVFDQPMDEQKTTAAWGVTDPDGAEVVGDVSWPNSRTLLFKPKQPMRGGALYRVRLSAEASSAKGLEMQNPVSFQFVTMGELEVSQVFPADGAQDISSDSVITVIFNRPIVPLVIAEEQANLPQPLEISPKLAGKGEWVNTSVYIFRPEPALKTDSVYQIRVKSGLEDSLGETRLAQDYAWSFRTAAPSIASFELSSGQVNPESYYKNVLPDAYFKISFQQAMDQSSVESALSLTTGANQAVDFNVSWNQEATTIVFTPTQMLALNTSYTLALASEAQAQGGGALKEGLSWEFATIPPPAIIFTQPENNSFPDHFDNTFFIRFASPMRLDTVKERIVISPRPAKDVEWWYNDWDWSMSGFFLQPSTRYEILFKAGMEDIYGNVTQTDTIVRFTTPGRSPFAQLAMPYSASVVRAFGSKDGQQFYVTHTNVKNITLTLASLTQQQFVDFLAGNESAYSYNPAAESIIWKKQETSAGKLDESVLKSYPFEGEDGKPLPPGFYFLGLDTPQITHHSSPYLDYRLVSVTGANLTFKTSSTGGLVWLTDLESGRPVPGALITIYDSSFSPIASGQTDRDGMISLELPAPKDPYEARFALSEDGSAFGFASSQWDSGMSPYDYGIWGDYYAPANQPTAYVYTERPIYRPGQPVYFKGIARLNNDLDYQIPEVNSVNVKISSYKDTVYEEKLPLSSFGSFDGKLLLDPEAALGYYTIEVRFPGSQEAIGSLTFNVAEYRKPEFRVELKANETNVLVGDRFRIDLQADYYSGGGVSEGGVDWTLTSEPFYFTPPPEFSGFSFRDFDEDQYRFEEVDTSSQTIAQGKGQTDVNGRFSETLTADLSDSATSRTLTFEATVTDKATSSVSGRTSVVVHQGSIYPGIRPTDYIGKIGKVQSFDLAALDWEGNPVAGQSLQVEIVERRWYSVQEQDASGRVTWKSTVQEIPVIELDDVVSGSDGKARVSFTPSAGGIYKATVKALDLHGKTNKSSDILWVAGDEFIPWRQTNDHSFDLVTDKKFYTPGDVAQVLIASPFEGEAYALVTIERGQVRFKEVIRLTSNSTVYELPITPDLAPNAFVSALVVKGVDDLTPRPDFKLGIREIQVDTRRQQLQVSLIPDRTITEPGEQIGYTVRTRDADGQPVSAEVSLSLSDLATLSLLPPNSAPMLDHFFSERGLGVWTAVPLSLGIDAFNAEIEENLPTGESGGSGGGKGDGEIGVIDVRQDFPDTAFWDPRVLTGENGEASVVVTLPDNLTTWRMEAKAVSKDTLVGQTTVDIVSTKPLLVRPQTPRFFVVNDLVRVGSAVNNNTDQALIVNVAVQAHGLILQGDTRQTLEIPARQQVFLTWEAIVDPDAERVDLIFSAEGGGLRDASKPPLGTLPDQGIPVYRFEANETVGTSGQMTSEGTRIESILMPKSLDVASGELIIKVQPSLAASMTDGLKYLQHFPYECVEQTVSRFLPNVITTRTMQTSGIQDPELAKELTEQVNTGMQRLYNWQNPDGGWGWWSNEKSDPLTSAYVLMGMIEAEDSGYPIDQAVVSRGLDYLRTQIVSITGLKDPTVVNRQAFLLYVLARAGSADVSSTVQLYSQRERMALFARAFLTRSLYIIDPDDPRLTTLLSDFASTAILSATGSHWEEESIDRLNWNTDTRTTAIILSTLSLIDPNSPLNVNAVRWLMSSRTSGRWQGTQETAWALMALTNWMAASGEMQANYQFAVGLNGDRLGGGIASSQTIRDVLELRVDASRLLKDEANRLAFARDAGPGNMYYTAHLNVSLPVNQIEPLDRGIVVNRSYFKLNELESPITSASVGDLLLARVTVVAPYALHFVIIDDPLPAGLEAVDQSLSTSPKSVEVPREYSASDALWRGWGWWYFSNIQRYDEKVMLSASYLPAGTYIYTYLVRAATAGSFNVIPTTAQEFYFPEVYGRGAGSMFTVTP